MGQHTGQLGLVFLNRQHGFLQGIGDVFLLWQAQQVRITGVVGQVKAAALNRNIRQRLLQTPTLELLVFGQDGFLVFAVFVVGKLQKNQAQHGGGIFTRLQVGVGAQAVGCTPEVGF